MKFYHDFFHITDEELWLLQTKLKNKELLNVTKYITKMKDNDKIKLSQIINDCYISDKNHLLELINDFKKNDPNNLNFYLGRFQLESILKKPFRHPSLLAFQFQGNPQVLQKPIVAIIGSRKPTYYGREQTQRFARALAQAGCTILSGGAIGIDAIANAVGHDNGSSCAIIGSGMKNLYPASNMKLFQNMGNSHNGLILSEFHPYEPPQKWNFPRRNLSIAALADFVLVVEAAFTSGSLITAHAAADLGTDVGALPGEINHINSQGTNELIKNGAFCIQTPQDVLERVCFLQKMKER
jgi:DNA processing protein